MKKITLIISLFLFLLTACGRETLPQPNMDSELFSWHNLNANIVNNRLIVSGQVNGKVTNLSKIILNVQAIDEDCELCPFIAEYSLEYYPNSVLDNKTSVFTVSYTLRNNSAKSYRWQLSGENYIFGINPIESPIYITKK